MGRTSLRDAMIDSNQVQQEIGRGIAKHIDAKIKEFSTYSRMPGKRKTERDTEIIFGSQVLQDSACYD